MNPIIQKNLRTAAIGIAGVIGTAIFSAAAEASFDKFEASKDEAPKTEQDSETETKTETKKTESK